MELFEEKLAGKSGGDILDVATQAGGFISQLQKIFKDYSRAVGIDITDEYFEEGRKKFENNPVEFVVMDGANLSFADATFDIVAICAGLHHLDNIAGTLSEMARVLKPGGWFLLREMFRDNENEKMITDTMQHDWFAEIDMVLGRNHFPTLTKQGIIDLVDSLGLRKVEMRERLCDNCPRSRGEKKDEEIADMDEQLEKIKGYPKYDGFKKRRDVIVERLLTIGIACSTQLDIVGIK